MNRLLICAVTAVIFGCCSIPAKAQCADAYDALLAHIDYLQADSAVMGQVVGLIDSGDFTALYDAAQVAADYVAAMAPPPPYDDGSVQGAVDGALEGMIAATLSLSDAVQARLDAAEAEQAALQFDANGQYDDAVAGYQAAAWDDPMGFGILEMDIWELQDRVGEAQYWLANWPEDPGGMMP